GLDDAESGLTPSGTKDASEGQNVSFYHHCAVGFFEPTSLVPGEVLRVVRPLDRREVEPLAKEYLGADRPSDGRRAVWWEDAGYLVVEYVALRPIDERVAFVQAVMDRTGCDAVDVYGKRVRGEPWPRAKR